MPTAKRTTVLSPAAAAEAQIAKLISKYEVEDQKLIQAVREFLQKRFPTANELVYDYARNFVIGYSPTEAGGEGIAALSADADGVRLYLTNGSQLPDPHKFLQGKAQARYLMLGSAKEVGPVAPGATEPRSPRSLAFSGRRYASTPPHHQLLHFHPDEDH